MESVAVIVDSQIVEDAVKGEMSRLYPASELEAADTSSAWRPLSPVGHPAHGGPEVRVVRRLVLTDVVVAQHDVLPVRQDQAGHGGSVRHHSQGETGRVGETESPHRPAFIVQPVRKLSDQRVCVPLQLRELISAGWQRLVNLRADGRDEVEGHHQEQN